MRQPNRASALLALFIGLVVPAAARAQDRASASTIAAMPLPGGLSALREVVNDPGRSDAGQLYGDLIRRSFQTTVSLRGVRREAAIRPILEHLDRAAKTSPAGPGDRLPLPLTSEVWMRAMLPAGARNETIAADILRSPSASLMYCGLLALDDATRRWFAAHPEVLSDVAAHHAAHFLVAAPGLRIRDDLMLLPGGAAAVAAWEAIVGKRAADPAAFIKGVVGRNEVALPYLLGSVAQLPPEQVRFALGFDGREQIQTTTLRRMATAFERVAIGWEPLERPFWRPTLDPALLASDLRAGEDGAPSLPGTAAFWSAVLSSSDTWRDSADAMPALAAGAPVEFSWLCEQVFSGGQTLIRPPYQLVLFASRRIPAVTAGNVQAALGALRAASQFPAVAGTLERAHITELSAYAEAAQRARALSAIGDDATAQVAMLQFQGALSVIARAASRGSLSPERAASLVSSLSAIAPDAHGEYAGKIVEWVSGVLLAGDGRPARAAAVVGELPAQQAGEAELLALLSGPVTDSAATLEWEGTRYRVSFTSAEAFRLHHLLGEAPIPYVSAADTMVRAAKTLESGTAARQMLAATAADVVAAAEAAQCTGKDEWVTLVLGQRCRDLVTPMARAAKSGDTKNVQRLAPRLRQLSDVLLARGLLVLAYAGGLGQPDNAVISAADAASRHNLGFDLPGFGRAGAWRWPASGADRVRDWHLTGSMLGIDVALSQHALVRITNRPPAARPSIDDEDRVVLSASVVLMEPGRLTNEDHTTIVTAMKRGRQRLAALRSAADAEALAVEIQMPAARRSLFVWTAGDDVARAAALLSPAEIFAAGLEGAPVPARLDAWGVSGEPRVGCQCLQLPGRRPLEAFAGRWFSGVLATGFADMNLRLAELLDELHMPGALLAPVLASATWDFLMNVRVSDFDDRSAWIEFVSAIGIDRVEQYLALLTTDGPLVPFTDGSTTR